jgi:hypothetical protein
MCGGGLLTPDPPGLGKGGILTAILDSTWKREDRRMDMRKYIMDAKSELEDIQRRREAGETIHISVDGYLDRLRQIVGIGVGYQRMRDKWDLLGNLPDIHNIKDRAGLL